MTAGFRTTNSNSQYTQITESYYNLALRYRGTLAVNVSSPVMPLYSQDVLLPGTTGVLAFSSNLPVVQVMAAPENGDTRYRFIAWDAGAVVTLYYFDDPLNALIYENESAGLLIWRKNGQLGFDSRRRYLRAVDNIHYESPVNGDQTHTYGADVLPAVIQGSVIYSQIGTEDPNIPNYWYTFQSFRGARVSGNSVITSEVVVRSNSSGSTPPAYAFVDVADYFVVNVSQIY